MPQPLARSLSLAAGACALAASLCAEPKLVLLGSFPMDKSVEMLAAKMAVDASNAQSDVADIGLKVVNGGQTRESNLKAAAEIAGDADVLGVVIHGEPGADPEVLQALDKAGLPVIAASSWATTRTAGTGATWLCPDLNSLAETAGFYAKKKGGKTQVAVLDNGAPTANAAARAFSRRFRAAGGKVPFDGAWNGDADSLPGIIKGMAVHWPQMIFYAGEPAAAAELAKALKAEKSLVNCELILLPSAFDLQPGSDPGINESAYLHQARLNGGRTRALFPCMDFASTAMFMRNNGFAFPQASPEYKAYLAYAFRKPGRWTSMLFDATALMARAFRAAAGPAPAPAAAEGATPTAQAAAPATRASVKAALAGIDSYRGIRGVVKFGPTREPQDDRVMVYFAQKKVNRKEMAWLAKEWGPPFQ
jgi:ABC-type branched-subunit amino acid transport system substrate-binding protein